MAKTVLNIQMDFERAKKQAQELESIAQELGKIANAEMDGCIAGIHAAWTGDNSEAYLKKCRELKKKIEETSKQLARTAQTIRTVAKNTYEADMAAATLAKL